jgi:hypothetical protein
MILVTFWFDLKFRIDLILWFRAPSLRETGKSWQLSLLIAYFHFSCPPLQVYFTIYGRLKSDLKQVMECQRYSKRNSRPQWQCNEFFCITTLFSSWIVKSVSFSRYYITAIVHRKECACPKNCSSGTRFQKTSSKQCLDLGHSKGPARCGGHSKGVKTSGKNQGPVL